MDNFILTRLKKGKKLVISNLIMTSIRLKHNNGALSKQNNRTALGEEKAEETAVVDKTVRNRRNTKTTQLKIKTKNKKKDFDDVSQTLVSTQGRVMGYNKIYNKNNSNNDNW